MFLVRIIQQNRFFRIARKLGNISNTNRILTFFELIKIHLEKSIFFLSHVCGETDGQLKSCRTSAAVLTIFF